MLALPANAGISTEDPHRKTIVRRAHFVSKGLALQLDAHPPHDVGAGSPGIRSARMARHLLIPTRRLAADSRLRRTRATGPEKPRRAGGRAVRAPRGKKSREQGRDLQVDPTATHASFAHWPGAHAQGRCRDHRTREQIRQANKAAARHPPNKTGRTLTRNNATFTERDVERYLFMHIAYEKLRAAVKAKLFEHQDVAAPVRARERGGCTGSRIGQRRPPGFGMVCSRSDNSGPASRP